jgi:hypothetical protein
MSTPLPSPRQEQFAQGLAAGLSRSAAYRKAYARPQGSSARACAARLSTKAHILQRVQEIRNEASPLATACLSALISSLEARARAEIDSGRLRSAVGLMERIAKVAGGVGWSTKVGMPLSDSEMGRDASDTLPGRVSGLNGSLAVRTRLWRSWTISRAWRSPPWSCGKSPIAIPARRPEKLPLVARSGFGQAWRSVPAAASLPSVLACLASILVSLRGTLCHASG